MMPDTMPTYDLEGHKIEIDRPKGYIKYFPTPRGPEPSAYPTDYGYFSDVINPDDDEELDVFMGSGGPHYGRFMKGTTMTGKWQPDEHKWYSGLTDDELEGVKQMYTANEPELLQDYRTFQDTKELLRDILAYGRLKKASSDLILVSGHSGAGKSTLAQQLAERMRLPLYHGDDNPAFKEFVKSHPADEIRNNPELREKYQAIQRQTALDAIQQAAGRGVVEGTQLGSLSRQELAGYPNRVFVHTPLKAMLRQRLARVKQKQLAKGKPWDETTDPEIRNQIAKDIYDTHRPIMNRYAKVPGTVRYHTRKNQVDDVLRDLSKSATQNPTLQQLLMAKLRSDQRDYRGKHEILHGLMAQRPDEFELDSEEGDIVGLTHSPTNFRIHAPRLILPHGVATKQANTALRRAVKLVPAAAPTGPYQQGRSAWDLILKGKRIGGMQGYVEPGGIRVRLSELDPKFHGMGLGKKMYGELARQAPENTLISDFIVSNEAQRVWQSMAKRPKSFTMIPPGTTEQPSTSLLGRFANLLFRRKPGIKPKIDGEYIYASKLNLPKQAS